MCPECYPYGNCPVSPMWYTWYRLERPYTSEGLSVGIYSWLSDNKHKYSVYAGLCFVYNLAAYAALRSTSELKRCTDYVTATMVFVH